MEYKLSILAYVAQNVVAKYGPDQTGRLFIDIQIIMIIRK